MKKRFLVIMLMLVLVLLLAACGCEHEWQEASCSAPKTCLLCGNTDGEALPHTWQDATCTEAKICSICSATEGEALGHMWQEATCTTVKTCTVCQVTEGEPLGHTYSKEEILSAATCTKAGEKQYTCAMCEHSTNETIAATGHKWTGATCTKAGVCAVCGATGSKANHNYVVVVKQEFNKTFAGQRVKTCQSCNIEISEYFTDSYVYDLNAINYEVGAYAKQLGFQVSYNTGKEDDYRYADTVLNLDHPLNGPDKLLKGAKARVDAAYQNYASSPAGIGAYTLHISAYYTQSGSLGVGYFGVSFDITS